MNGSMNPRRSSPTFATGRCATMRRESLITQLIVWESEFVELQGIPSQDLDLNHEGLIYDGTNIPVDQTGRNRLLKIVGAPVSYIAGRSDYIQNSVLREHLQNGDL